MFQSLDEQGWYNPSGGDMGPHPSQEGHVNGGGFIDGPLTVSSHDGRGLWRPEIGADPEELVGPVKEGHLAGDSIRNMVDGWDSSYLSGRRPDWE